MRSLSGIFLMTAVFSFFTVQVFTQNTSSASVQKKEVSTVTAPGKFIDKNNNGVCDNFEARNANGKGVNFVDKDGDGICDHRQNAAPCKESRDCCGKGKGNRGNCIGSCCGKGSGNGCGQGHQHRHGWQDQKATPATDQPAGNKKN
jgi:hypothetical protein